jgi:hypothetical protein
MLGQIDLKAFVPSAPENRCNLYLVYMFPRQDLQGFFDEDHTAV